MAVSMFDLTGKVALVTGGNAGIGLGMAKALAQAGADLCIWGRKPDANAAAAEELRACGTRVLALECDVSDEDQVNACFAKTVETLGKVDACFANAGMGGRGTPFHDLSTEEWKQMMGVNLDGVFYTFRAAARHMKARGEGGSLVATSSLSAVSGMARGEHYASTKGAILSMCRGLAVEYGKNGIRANAIIPGWIDTNITGDWFSTEGFQKKVLPRIPARRWGKPDDFGGIAVYFASDASAYHTGDMVIIDGGYINF
ncbi:MAG: SDR family oxidoreductase [Desulfatibacillum sp.]|nr:SDR family oxidoreductase [Desulfatibacillum sp.]